MAGCGVADHESFTMTNTMNERRETAEASDESSDHSQKTPATAAIGPEITDKIVLLLVSGMGHAALDEALTKLGITAHDRPLALADARQRILLAAEYQRDEQTGIALVRLNDIYRRSLAIQDAKTALAAQKELNKLLDLYRAPPAAASGGNPDIEMARRHLAGLKLAAPDAPLAELARLAVLKVIELTAKVLRVEQGKRG